MSDENHFWGVQYVPVTANGLHELLRTEDTFMAAIQRESRRVLGDMLWGIDDEKANGHLGPRLGPGRRELHEARRRLRQLVRQDEYFRSLGRPAGPYQRGYFQDPMHD